MSKVILITLEQMVRAELEKYPCTRDSDRELTIRTWHDYFGVSYWAPVLDVMRRRDLPSQESLGRIRRKLQEKDESLRGSAEKERVRYNAQKDFMDYANEADN